MEIQEINLKIRDLMKEGHGHIVMQNPMAKHSLVVGILNRLRLDIERVQPLGQQFVVEIWFVKVMLVHALA